MELRNAVFFLIGNIPASFRSASLRNFFSYFVEKKAFVCFHYRHRPEQIRHKEPLEESAAPIHSKEIQSKSNSTDIAESRCCVVAVEPKFEKEFAEMYRNKNWSHSDGSLLASKVRSSKLKVKFSSSTADPENAGIINCRCNGKGKGSSRIYNQLGHVRKQL